MKKLLLSLLLATGLFGADAANDLILSQRKPDNSGNIQRNLAPTARGFFSFDGSKVPVSTTDFTYTSPALTVPDAFNISSAGSISLTAGGAAKDVTLKSSTTGNIVGNLGGVASTFVTAPRFQGLQLYAGQDVRTGVTLDTVGTQTPTFLGRHAKITTGALSGVVANDVLASFFGEGYGSTGYVNTGRGLSVVADDTWTDSVAGSKLQLGVTLKGGTTGLNAMTLGSDGSMQIGGTARTIANPGVTAGFLVRVIGTTVTDSSSSTGTVASTAFNTFGQSTINATNANVVYTNLANAYIAGDPTTTGNATATNSYGLWNVGKTRLDGNALIGTTSLLNFGATALGNIGVSADTTAGILQIKSPTSGTTTLYTANALSATISGGASLSLTGGAGNMTETAGTGASRTWTLRTTTSGSTATNAIVANATQDVSIATGNLTIDTIGKTLSVKSGTNAKAGSFTLSSGAATVSTTGITANSVVVMSLKTASGTVGSQPRLTALTAGTSFVVAGTVTDNSTYNYIIFEVN